MWRRLVEHLFHKHLRIVKCVCTFLEKDGKETTRFILSNTETHVLVTLQHNSCWVYDTRPYFLLLHPSGCNTGGKLQFCYLALPVHLELEDIFPTDNSLWSTSLRPIILLPLTTGAFITFLHHHIQVCNVNVLILSIPVKPAHAFLSTLCSPRIQPLPFFLLQNMWSH